MVTDIAVSEANTFAAAEITVRSGVAALGLRRGGVDQGTGGLDPHRHVGQHELDALEVGDGLTELLALSGVGQRLVKRPLCHPDGLGADRQPGVVEGGQRGLKAGTGLADDAIGRESCSRRSRSRRSVSL